MISANPDEKAFDKADRFDVGRDPNRHDSLGAGQPVLLGAGSPKSKPRCSSTRYALDSTDSS